MSPTTPPARSTAPGDFDDSLRIHFIGNATVLLAIAD